jgi:hypothetical protein
MVRVTVSDDKTTIVCWHPEQPVLYEHTKPMPVIESKYVDSVLRPEIHEEVDMIMRKTDLTQEDLIRLTYRPRLNWRPDERKNTRHVRHPDPPIDRIGL